MRLWLCLGWLVVMCPVGFGQTPDAFAPAVNGVVYASVEQTDGRVIIAGSFSAVGGVGRNYVARLNADGSLDSGFNPGANNSVLSITAQADGKILLGGAFTTVNGVSRNYVARLNADGSVDSGFNPGANSSVLSLSVQSDGRILLGGQFTTMGGVSRSYFARLPNDGATQALVVTGTTQVDWQRRGSAPEVSQVTFESWNGSAWVSQGTPVRVAGGWQATGLSLPTSGWVRARGRTSGGYLTGSSGLVENLLAYGSNLPDVSVETSGGTVLADGVSVLDVGTQDWRTTGAVRTLTIRNTGTADLTGLAVSVDGVEAGDFSVGNPGATTLAPGASTTIAVSFTARGAGVRSATLHLTSNDADETPFDLALTGTGLHQDTAFAPSVNGAVNASVAQPDGRVIIAGSFTTVNGVSRNRVARLNADGSVDTGFNPDANSIVHSLSVQADGKILLGAPSRRCTV